MGNGRTARASYGRFSLNVCPPSSRLGEGQELIYLPLYDSRFDGDVVLGQSLRSFQSSFHLFHLFGGNSNAVGIIAVEAFDGWVLTSPGHPQRALENYLQAVEQHAVPFL